MKIPKKQELQQTSFDHSSDVCFKDFFNLYKKCTATLFSFSVVGAALASDNPSPFRKNLLEKI